AEGAMAGWFVSRITSIYHSPPHHLTTLRQTLTKNHHVVSVRIVIALKARLFVVVFEIEFSRWLIVLKGRGFDEKLPAILAADVFFQMAKKPAPDPARLRVLAHGDPPELPGSVGHGRGCIIRKSDRCAILFIGNAPCLGMLPRLVIIQYFT